jgi:hypothetical protein
MYRAQAVLTGTNNAGVTFIRSTQHLLPITTAAISLQGQARAIAKDKDHLDILLSVQSNDHSKLYRAYGELWAVNTQGKEIPVCWLSSLVNTQTASGKQVVVLELNTNWLKRAGAKAPLTLKNVMIQDSEVHVPLSSVNQIPIVVSNKLIPTTSGPMNIPITKEMRQGVAPRSRNITSSKAAPTLMLVHGYCANVNPWKGEHDDFKDATYFLEPSASMTNQDFADLVIKHAEELGMTHWGGIGHSQGGHVLAHILNYYHTGLDQSKGGRKVQTVGTPWQGCSGAGSAASLIDLFGVGCGSNFDLTIDGSKLWLAGITPETKKELYYFTTTYKQGTFFGDYCNLAVNFVLKWPNDGTAELTLSQLSGANNMGNKEKWCHTEDMGYTAQYLDHTRNAQMNTAAAR